MATLADTYRLLRAEAVQLDPTQAASFNQTCIRKADAIVNSRLSKKYRFYTGPETARKNGAPTESLPTQADFVAAAEAQVEFLKWAVENVSDCTVCKEPHNAPAFCAACY